MASRRRSLNRLETPGVLPQFLTTLFCLLNFSHFHVFASNLTRFHIHQWLLAVALAARDFSRFHSLYTIGCMLWLETD